MSKIGFLFIDQSYSIYHSILVAIALSFVEGNKVTIFSTPRNRHLTDALLLKHKNSNIAVITIRPYWLLSIPHYLEIKLQFRNVLFFKYRKDLADFDIICCNLYGDLTLKKYLPISNGTKFIYLQHGIANTKYSFDEEILEFDLFTMSGNYEKMMRTKLNQLRSNNYLISGYLKYELLQNKEKKRFFLNNKPTIVYNPHWNKKFSSFPEFGFKVLDYFSSSNKYNLIFAPHSLLMVRNKIYYLKLLKYKNIKNILIDLGSEASNDFTYTKSADLYLGDVSSQAWEFALIKNRPCIFIVINKLNENPDEFFLSWELGKIISNVSNIEKNIDTAFDSFESTFQTIQENKIKQMFFQSSIKPSQLVVNAIQKI